MNMDIGDQIPQKDYKCAKLWPSFRIVIKGAEYDVIQRVRTVWWLEQVPNLDHGIVDFVPDHSLKWFRTTCDQFQEQYSK